MKKTDQAPEATPLRGTSRLLAPLNTILLFTALAFSILTFQASPVDAVAAGPQEAQPATSSPNTSVDPVDQNLNAPAGKDFTSALKEFSKEAPLAVAMVDLKSGETLIDYNGNKQFTAASTYKLFTVLDMYRQIESGKITPDSDLSGYTIEECIEYSLEYSDNDCIEEWLFTHGHEQSQKIALASGSRGTSFEPFDIQTTANDLSEFLKRLYNGELLSPENTQQFISHMQEQIWRDAIPQGLGEEITVANKPGFLEDVTHDAAIIYTPLGDYALVILTESDSFELIADISATVYEILEQ